MGKSRTSPLQKTGSSIGVGVSGSGIGASGLNSGFTRANSQGQQVTQLSVDGAQPINVSTNIQANKQNNANFSDIDNADYHTLYNGRQYYANQSLSIDGRIATMNYLSDKTESGSLYSVSQNMNHNLENGLPLSANQTFTKNALQASMHNLGYNLNLQRYDHADGINNLLSSMGLRSYDSMSESQLKSALVGTTWKNKSFLSTSYNDFKNAPSNNPFTDRAVKFVYSAKAKTQAMMPGNGPGGKLGEMVLGLNNSLKITDVKFDGRRARYKGTQSYGAKGLTVYVDVE